MPSKARWITRSAVWVAIVAGAAVATRYHGEMSARAFVPCLFWVSLAMTLLGFIYFAGGAAGDAFPPHTVIDLNASENRRGQPLDHGRGSLSRPFPGGVVMIAAGIPAVLSLAPGCLVTN